jgi:hypothetical protein
MRSRRPQVAVTVVLAATILIAGCSSGSKKSSSATAGSSTQTTLAVANTKPFKVMVAGDITGSSGFANPEIVPAAKSVLGKIGGVQIEVCDSKGDAGDAASCERQAVQDNVAAVIVGAGIISQDQAILTKAGIPTIGDTDATSATAFSLVSGLALFPGIGIGLVQAGCHRMGILELNGNKVLGDSIRRGAESAGGQEVARAEIPLNAPDLAPAIAKLRQAKVECIAVSVFPTQVAQAVAAINQSGPPLPVAGVSAIITPDVIKSLGAQADGIIEVDAALDGTDAAAPGIAQMKTDLKAVDPKAPASQLAVTTWTAAKLLVAALPNVQGPVTAPSMLVALNGLRDVSTDGVIPPFSAIELSNPVYRRDFNHFGVNYTITNGVPKRTTGFYDLGPALK